MRDTNHQTRECATNKRRSRSTRASDRSRSLVRSGACKSPWTFESCRPISRSLPKIATSKSFSKHHYEIRALPGFYDTLEITCNNRLNLTNCCNLQLKRIQKNLFFWQKLKATRTESEFRLLETRKSVRAQHDREYLFACLFCKMSIRGGGLLSCIRSHEDGGNRWRAEP